MNNLLVSAYGIDVAINDVQSRLYSSLVNRWSGDIDGYGRIHKNQKIEGKFYPEYYLGNGQYKEVYYDNKRSDFFFIVSDDDPTEDEMVFTSKVKCVFMVNLDLIYPNDAERSDIKAQRDAVEMLRESSFGEYVITGITKTVSGIFTGFDSEKIKSADIQPAHCFSINMDLSYYLTDKCE